MVSERWTKLPKFLVLYIPRTTFLASGAVIKNREEVSFPVTLNLFPYATSDVTFPYHDDDAASAAQNTVAIVTATPATISDADAAPNSVALITATPATISHADADANANANIDDNANTSANTNTSADIDADANANANTSTNTNDNADVDADADADNAYDDDPFGFCNNNNNDDSPFQIVPDLSGKPLFICETFLMAPRTGLERLLCNRT